MICIDPLRDTTPFTRPGTPRCFRNAQSCHMFSDLPNIEGSKELMEFALSLGLRDTWLQDGGTPTEHFDLTAARREAAVRAGATGVSFREMGEIFRSKRLRTVYA